MIFRAVFWIGLVSLLTPHEPDLGLGRPGAGALPPSPATILPAASGLSRQGSDCGKQCAGGLGFLKMFHLDGFHLDDNNSVIDRLADVKAQIKADQEARARRGRAV